MPANNVQQPDARGLPPRSAVLELAGEGPDVGSLPALSSQWLDLKWLCSSRPTVVRDSRLRAVVSPVNTFISSDLASPAWPGASPCSSALARLRVDGPRSPEPGQRC